MLITLLVILIAWFSGGVEWQSAAAGGSSTTVPTITPQDPSSLTLALIGGGMLAVYFTLSRTIRSRPPVIKTRSVSGSAKVVDGRATEADQPSRGAA